MLVYTSIMDSADKVGHGSGIVVGTGKDTEFGVVFEMMQDVRALWYLQVRR